MRGTRTTSDGRGRSGWLCALVVVANAVALAWAAAVCHDNRMLLGTACLAYILGLRHAVDADHIAAIDNATRKLIEAGRRANTTGLFFSLGHATVVLLASLAIALTSARLQTSMVGMKLWAQGIGTGISVAALFALAIANVVVLVSVCRVLGALRRGERPLEAELHQLLARRGLLGRLLRGTFRLICRSWQMYPLGFLFGLGFDTATEIGALGVAAAQASNGLPIGTVLMFPTLFTAGMVLIDTLDAIFMDGAYRWASREPLRKLYYNVTVTLTSVVVAIGVGGIEVLALVCNGKLTAGGLWWLINFLNDHLGVLGCLIIGAFAISWLVSHTVWRRARRSSAELEILLPRT